MNLLIENGRVIDPATNFDRICPLASVNGRFVAINNIASDFQPDRVIDARGCIVAPGLVDLCARVSEPGHEHAGMQGSEMASAVAGGVTSIVCPPDTNPVLDEPGLVQMLKIRAEQRHQARLFPLGALTRALAGSALTDMAELTRAGCVGFGQADTPLVNTLVLQRAMQYAATYGYGVWLRPQDAYLSSGVAASGALATRLGLSGVPAASETIALYTIVELMRATGARVHVCRVSTAAGVALVRAAKAEGLPITADVSINSLHLTDTDIGYFDSRARVNPPLRQARDRTALREALADGTLDALVSDHTPVGEDGKTLPFAEALPGATGVELLLGLALKWSEADGVPLLRALAVLTSGPAGVLGASLGPLDGSCGRIAVGGAADLCIFDPQSPWPVEAGALRSRGKHTPFAFEISGTVLPSSLRFTVVNGLIAYECQRK